MYAEDQTFQNDSHNKHASDSILSSMAEAIACRESHTIQLLHALKLVSAPEDTPLDLDERRIRNVAGALDISTKGKTTAEIADELAEFLLLNLDVASQGFSRVLSVVVPPERVQVWKELGVLDAPESEVSNAEPSRKNPDPFAAQILRSSISFLAKCLAGNHIASDCLFGSPERTTTSLNLERLQANTINIALHNEFAAMAEYLLAASQQKKALEAITEAGAAGVQLYGISKSSETGFSNADAVAPLSSPKGVGSALATGALDILLTDTHHIFTGMLDIASCNRTTVISPNNVRSLPGVEPMGDADDKAGAEALAEQILFRAIESFKARKKTPRHIPSGTDKAIVGFSLEAVDRHFGCLERVASALIDGRIRGIVCLSGCHGHSAEFDTAITGVADTLLKNNILIFTNGCVSLPLIAHSYCSTEAQNKCGDMLQLFLGQSMPPVWHFGGCIDNTQILATFREIAKYAGRPIKELPFAAIIPECNSGKEVNAALSFHLFGVDSIIHAPSPSEELQNMLPFMRAEELKKLGASMSLGTDMDQVAQQIISEVSRVRSELCWR